LQQQHVELLSTCDLLRHLPAEGIRELLAYVHLRQVDAGETLFCAGDPGDALYIVARGRVEVLQAPQPTISGERVIAKLGEGSAFGEMALLSGAPRTATVRAVTDVELLQSRRTTLIGW
jgi:CRP-like cAMP-binding protein